MKKTAVMVLGNSFESL